MGMMNKAFFDEPVVRRGSGCYKWDEEPGDDYLPMWVADMDFHVAPAITEALRKRVEHGVFGYTLVGDEYYEAVTRWFERRHNWHIEREWIQYTTGVVPAMSVVVKAFTQPGDKVIMQTPAYNCFFTNITNNGCEVVASKLLPPSSRLLSCHDNKQDDRYTMDFDDLERKASDPKAKLFILCNPHNPVGRRWTREELQRVSDICKRNGVIVVCDEIHNELTFGQERYVPYGTVDMENAIICTSASKSFNIAGLQMANIICANEEWRRKIDRAININEVCDVNPFGPIAAIAAYNEGEEWLDTMCDYIHDNYLLLQDFAKKEMPLLKVTPLEATYLAWVDIRGLNIDADTLTQRLLDEEHLHVNSGTMYDHDESGKDYIRLNLACPKCRMEEGLKRLKRVYDRLV